MVLSDRTITRLIAAGRSAIDPYDPSLMQPASLDVRVDRLFRVFRSSRDPSIDVKLEPEDMTELVEGGDDEAFSLQPGRRAGSWPSGAIRHAARNLHTTGQYLCRQPSWPAAHQHPAR